MSPFRVLYRQFLFRLADLEALSAHAQGDLQKLLAQFAALLIFISLLLTGSALLFSQARLAPPEALALTVASERFLIATTMLVVGLFAVLCWDSTFPDRRDVYVLAPLPVRARTIFLAKIAAVGSALAITAGLLHAPAGFAWPIAFATQARPQTLPTMAFDPALPPLDSAQVRADLDRALPQLPPGIGLSIGIVKHGGRSVFAYGAASTDSIFEAGSVSKTFTSLILAEMAEQGKARLDEPLLGLLPPLEMRRRPGEPITLLDLATHHSGLPRAPVDRASNTEELYRALVRYGVWKIEPPPFQYSNFAVAVMGQALAHRAGTTYAALVNGITAAIGLPHTFLAIPPEQQARVLAGYNAAGLAPPLELDGYAPAGGIRSTAGDLLTYLEAQLHPERVPSLAAAIRATHAVRDLNGPPGMKMALGWMYRPDARLYAHGGATPGFLTAAFFSLDGDYAAVVLRNHGTMLDALPDLVAERIRQRLAGEPALAFGNFDMGASRNPLRWFAAYWFTMLAASTFLFCCILAVQGVATLALPRPIFLRVSGVLQIAAFCLFVGVYFFEPKIPSMDAFTSSVARDRLARFPTYWFLGLFHQLNGSMHPAFAPFARRAWIGLIASIATTAAAYILAYVRTLRQIVEQPDIVPALRRARWWPQSGRGAVTAIAQFSARSLLRSRQHRVILAFYLGVGFALTIWFAKTPAVQGTPADAQAIAASIVLLGFWIAGTRVVFSLPLNLGASWVFRALPLRSGPPIHAARRRALFALAVLPGCAIAAVVFLSLWPWRPALAHVAALALAGATLVEICAGGPQKIPFACSYLPGKSNVHITFWLCDLFIFLVISKASEWEARILASPLETVILLGVLAGAALAARALGNASASRDLAGLRFEEEPGDAIQKIGLDPGAWRAAGI